MRRSKGRRGEDEKREEGRMTREKREWEKRGKNGGRKGERWDYSSVAVHCFEDTVTVVVQ
jgi:hypothetical protein